MHKVEYDCLAVPPFSTFLYKNKICWSTLFSIMRDIKRVPLCVLCPVSCIRKSLESYLLLKRGYFLKRVLFGWNTVLNLSCFFLQGAFFTIWGVFYNWVGEFCNWAFFTISIAKFAHQIVKNAPDCKIRPSRKKALRLPKVLQ